MLGFYLEKEEDEKIHNKEINKNNITNNNQKEYSDINNNTKKKKIFIIIGVVIIGIGLLLGAYFIGMKVKEGRKKRANELMDDSYEYIPENKKDINEINYKDEKLLELNSKLG